MLAIGAAAHAGHQRAHVVIGHAAADDQHALIAKRHQCAADLDVLCGIHAGQQRDLHDRHIGVRKGDFQRDEDAMIEAALAVVFPRNTRSPKQLRNARGNLGRPGSRKLDLIGVRRKAVVIVKQRRRRIVLDGDNVLFPMAGNHHQRFWPRSRHLGHVPQIVGHPGPGIRRIPIHKETGPAAMRDEESGKPAHILILMTRSERARDRARYLCPEKCFSSPCQPSK